MRRYLLLFVFLAVTLLVLSKVRADYSLQCTIDVVPHNSQAIVTTRSIFVNITIKNIGNNEFPNSTVYVQILTPQNNLLENYYSFQYDLHNLSINNSSWYEAPFNYQNESGHYALYETPLSGTWHIDVKILPLFPNGTIYTSYEDVVRSNGECRKYFSVEEYSQYQRDVIDITNQNRTLDLTNNLSTLTQNLTGLTTILILLGILGASSQINKFSKKIRIAFIPIAGVFVGIAFLIPYINPSFNVSIIYPFNIVIAVLVFLSTFLFVFLDLDIKLEKRERLGFKSLAVLVLNGSVFLTSFYLFWASLNQLFSSNYLQGFGYILLYTIGMFSSYSYIEILIKEND